MHEELNFEDESVKHRPSRSARMATPRASRSLRKRKKSSTPATPHGGSHRRRNKHWSW